MRVYAGGGVFSTDPDLLSRICGGDPIGDMGTLLAGRETLHMQKRCVVGAFLSTPLMLLGHGPPHFSARPQQSEQTRTYFSVW